MPKRFWDAQQPDVDDEGVTTTSLKSSTSSNTAKVTNADPSATDYGLVVRSFIDDIVDGDLYQRSTNAGQGFQVDTDIQTVTGTTKTAFFLLKNPVGSGKTIRFQEFTFTFGSVVAGQSTTIQIYRSPTITANGTALTINKTKSDGVTSSVASAFLNPTISANGTLVQAFVVVNGTFKRNLNLNRYLVAGANLLITVDSTTANAEHSVFSSWIEV